MAVPALVLRVEGSKLIFAGVPVPFEVGTLGVGEDRIHVGDDHLIGPALIREELALHSGLVFASQRVEVRPTSSLNPRSA